MRDNTTTRTGRKDRIRPILSGHRDLYASEIFIINLHGSRMQRLCAQRLVERGTPGALRQLKLLAAAVLMRGDVIKR